MKLNLINLEGYLAEGVAALKEDFGYEMCQSGIPITVSRGDGIKLSLSNGEGFISYEKKHHFFRALVLFLENAAKSESFNIHEVPKFETTGIMLDASRNGVMKVEAIKKYLRYMASMGLNMLMMYTEDTYELPQAPYFGYMRGRYTKEELSECDSYADMFGIEMMPCIQTLGHMTQYLKWADAFSVQDTNEVLMVGSEQTYELIEQMITAATAPFKSNRIHLGMDEAHNMGLGHYLQKNGYRNQFDIFVEHLNRVLEITSKLNLRPMIWSDMFFRTSSKNHAYYDILADIPKEVADRVPKEVELVYWDYYNRDKNMIGAMIDKHLGMERHTIFAGGIWTWCGFLPNNRFTLETTNPLLEVSFEKGIKEVIATVWANNGCETNQMMSVWGMQLFAEHTYSEQYDEKKLAERFAFCTGGDSEAFMRMSDFHISPEDEIAIITEFSTGKKLLWSDVMLGFMDDYLANKPMTDYYKRLGDDMLAKAVSESDWKPYYEYAATLFKLLEQKCFIAERLKPAYDKNDKDFLSACAKLYFPDLLVTVKTIHALHEKLWMDTYKPFGWEVIDIRYGGLMARIETAAKRILNYLNNELRSLPELNETRLPHNPVKTVVYAQNATACNEI